MQAMTHGEWVVMAIFYCRLWNWWIFTAGTLRFQWPITQALESYKTIEIFYHLFTYRCYIYLYSILIISLFGSYITCTLDRAQLPWFYEYKPKVFNFPGSPITS